MTDVPDYISPIISYRVWQWDVAGLRSLNGELWRPGKPLEARCKVSDFASWVGRDSAAHAQHNVPHIDCTCGVYANKGLEHLRECFHEKSLIYGQVSLWGSVVEHQHGWRAQYAYPKRLFLAPEILPVTLRKIQARLSALISYRCDIIILGETASIPLWTENLGLVPAGLDFLMSRSSKWYSQHNQERRIKRGDGVAIIGRGIAVVEEVNGKSISAILGTNSLMRIDRKRLSWNRQNVRWETNTAACCEANRKS